MNRQRGLKAVWGEYVNESEKRKVPYASYSSFVAAAKQRPRYEQTKKRQGPRAAYQHESFYWTLDRATTPRHGDRPFEIAHIDHTELDIELRCSRTGRNLGRPWATFMVDAYTRRVLVVYLSYDPPSYRTCMAVIRECVRRHGRMPQTIVVDGGWVLT